MMKNDRSGCYQVAVSPDTLEVLGHILRSHGLYPKTPEQTIKQTLGYLANCHMKLEKQWYEVTHENMILKSRITSLNLKIKTLEINLEGLNNGN